MSCLAMATIITVGKASVHQVSWRQSGRNGGASWLPETFLIVLEV